MGSIWYGRGAQDVQTLPVFLVFHKERKQNAIVTEGNEVGTHKQVCRIVGKGNWDNLLEYRIYMVRLEWLRCTNSAHYFVFSRRKKPKCDSNSRE
jgi:hypothetical protein